MSLSLILSEKISDSKYYSTYEYKMRFSQNGAGAIPIGLSIARFIVTFPTLKQQFSIKSLIAVLSDVLLKPNLLLFSSPSMLHHYEII